MALFRRELVGVLLVAVLVSVRPTSADDDGFRDKIAKCFTQDWLRGFLPCAVAKFEGIIELLQPIIDRLPSQPSSGRQLLSSHPEWASFLSPQGQHHHTNKYHQFVSAVHDRHDEYQRVLLDSLHNFRPQNKDEHHRTLVVKQVAQLDFVPVLGEYHRAVHEQVATLQLLGLLANASSTIRSQHPATPSTHGVQSVLDLLAALLQSICDSNDLGEDLQEECVNTVELLQCLAQQDNADIEDSLTWTKCVYQCRDLPVLSSCVAEQFSSNLECELPWPVKDLSWMAPVAMKLMMGFLELDHCTIKLVSPNRNETLETLTLVEGDAPQTLAFSMYVPPGVLCVNPALMTSPLGLVKGIAELLSRKVGKCDVTVHLSTQSFLDAIAARIPPVVGLLPNGGGVPACRSKVMRRQAALGMHPLANETLGAGRIPITDANWNETFYVPLVATTDSKPSGDSTEADFVFRLKAGRRYLDIIRVPLLVQDSDSNTKGETSCYALGRGHMITFGQAYYNNYYEGHFYLYKHNDLPYEVQAVYQACSSSRGTCACAVAVLFGDDVFVVDGCRRKDPSSDNTGSEPLVRSILYQNGDITPNARIHRKDEGLKFQVLLPLGTLVTIVVHDEHLSTFIRPSASDLTRSKGLCDVYANSASSQVTMPDGVTSAVQEGAIPRDFVKAWRVPEEAQLIQGALVSETGADDTRYCSCTHVLYMGSTCTCGDAFRTETCDMDTDGDMGADLSQIIIPSVKQYIQNTGDQIAHALDLDLEYEPQDPSWEGVVMSQSQANSYCRSAVGSDPVVEKCYGRWGFLTVGSFSHTQQTKVCVAGIQASNSTGDMFPSIEAVRQKCRDRLYQDSRTSQADAEDFAAFECPRDCSSQGHCINGTCHCSDGFTGPSCSIPGDSTPQVMMPATVLCDSRHEDCAWAKIFGYHFRSSVNIDVEAIPLRVDANGAVPTEHAVKLTAKVLTPTQAAAQLPSMGSHRILATAASSRAIARSQGGYTYLVYDSQCYRCDVLKHSCSRKTTQDNCVIDGVCLAAMTLDPSDSCYLCDPHQTRDDWAIVDSDVCQSHHAALVSQQEEEKRMHTVRIISAVVLSAGVVLATLVLYLLVGRKSRAVDEEISRIQSSIHRGSSGSRSASDGPTQTQAVAYATKAPSKQEAARAFGDPIYQSSVSVVSDADYNETL